MKTWNETYTEENLKEKKLTLSWKTNISKVYYTDLDVDFSKIHFLPLNDEQNLVKSKYYMLTALALNFSNIELMYQTSALLRGTNYIIHEKIENFDTDQNPPSITP